MKLKYFSIYLFFIMLLLFIVFTISYNKYKKQYYTDEMKKHAIVIENNLWFLDLESPVKYLTLVSIRDNCSLITVEALDGSELILIEGAKLSDIGMILYRTGLIREYQLIVDIIHEEEKIGKLIVMQRNENIYLFFFSFIFFTLLYFVITLFLKTVLAKHQLENRVRHRTIELEEEIEEREKVGLELENARNYISNIIDSMPSVLIGVDADGNITQWNRKAEELTGFLMDSVLGRKLPDVYPEMKSEMKTVFESIRTCKVKNDQKKPFTTDSGIRFKDITIYPLISEGVEGAVIIIDDITEKIQMEEMMIQGEKMLSVGGLAAGMAHEINNPLAGMMQTAGVLLNRLSKRVDMPANVQAAENVGTTMDAIKGFMEKRGIIRMISSINDSGKRAAIIVENMLSFARKSEGQTSSYYLEDLIDKTLTLAATDYDLKKRYDFKMIDVVREYDENLPPITCDGAKIQQVLLNIFQNGAQAMYEAKTENSRFIIRIYYKKDEEMIGIDIEDNGPGMPEEVRKRIFEPFFTTKPVGVGTGLGLSVSYFIVTENHNGKLKVESEPGVGTKFSIHLPTRLNI